MLIKLLILFLIINTNAEKYPVVMWHGMGDTCCFPFSLGSIKKLLQSELNNTYVKSLQIGGNVVMDYESGFFIHPNTQVEYACQELAKDEKLKRGYNAIGFSQGGQFLRALAQRCPLPPMKVLITMGGQHQGVFGLPKCPSLKSKTCEYIRRLLNTAAYDTWTQLELVQATYWHDPLDEEKYKARSTFLADINNEVFVNGLYADNLNKLEKFVMVKFLNDTIVQPKESQWFEFYKPGQDKEILPLKESPVYEQLGLNHMAANQKLMFLEAEGDHLQFNKTWFLEKIIPLLNQDIN
ncbi:Palmitoyl-protein thioesterase 1 [Lucilia cuprina]|uniref:Palmitoyl-protein thioesterase 1 n=1 Tax=Lucilia cuprina TaxID=7375 RepID=A0A0L0CIU0_LUCCU|nr:Palmitoyl-protein thioesterase 1 [Lucilia cuprina]KNC32175.1 Palmitoyl-protein thioesterase 1 [Lucilia cuprina]